MRVCEIRLCLVIGSLYFLPYDSAAGICKVNTDIDLIDMYILMITQFPSWQLNYKALVTANRAGSYLPMVWLRLHFCTETPLRCVINCIAPFSTKMCVK